jgi:hypothetical protein
MAMKRRKRRRRRKRRKRRRKKKRRRRRTKKTGHTIPLTQEGGEAEVEAKPSLH